MSSYPIDIDLLRYTLSLSLLSDVPGLWMVETLDSVKCADSLNRHWGLRDRGDHPLRVLVQVNTSSEDSESTVGIMLILQNIRDRSHCQRFCFDT